MVGLSAVLVTLLFAGGLVSGRVLTRCELAEELGEKTPSLSTWICIAEHESALNTSAHNPVSGDHGLFQISELFWCSPKGEACGVTCDSLRDDELKDDWKCARRIYRAHTRLQGEGFRAWAVYAPHCAGDTSHFLEGCFGTNSTATKLSTPTPETETPSTPSSPDTTPETTPAPSSTPETPSPSKPTPKTTPRAPRPTPKTTPLP